MAAIPAVVVIPPPPPVPEIDQIKEILNWIGFTDAAQRDRICNDAFTNYADILSMNEKDVTELSASFSRRTATNGKIDFGIRRTKKLMHLLHFVQDAARTSYTASTFGYTQATLLSALTVAGERELMSLNSSEINPMLKLRKLHPVLWCLKTSGQIGNRSSSTTCPP